MLPALAHVPPAHVKASFELVIDAITDVTRYEKLKKQMQNIRSTYEFESAVPYLGAVAEFK